MQAAFIFLVVLSAPTEIDQGGLWQGVSGLCGAQNEKCPEQEVNHRSQSGLAWSRDTIAISS
jgi:hypothetical protein